MISVLLFCSNASLSDELNSRAIKALFYFFAFGFPYLCKQIIEFLFSNWLTELDSANHFKTFAGKLYWIFEKENDYSG